jgi:hypothetical protein
VDREIQRGEPITVLLLIFQNFELFNRNVSRSQCQPLLKLLTTTTTLSECLMFEARQDSRAATVFQWILRALLNRAPALPAIPGIICDGADMTAEDMARLLNVCRPERLTWADIGIVHTTLCPTNHDAMEHLSTALRGMSSSLKRLRLSSDLFLSGTLLHGLQNHNDHFEIEAISSGDHNTVLLTLEEANGLIELLQHYTGEWKKLVLTGYRFQGDPVFASLTCAFRDSLSFYEVGFEKCIFDAASSRLLCAAFSSPEPKAIMIGQSVGWVVAHLWAH